METVEPREEGSAKRQRGALAVHLQRCLAGGERAQLGSGEREWWAGDGVPPDIKPATSELLGKTLEYGNADSKQANAWEEGRGQAHDGLVDARAGQMGC